MLRTGRSLLRIHLGHIAKPKISKSFRLSSSFEAFPVAKGLYNKSLEKDSCGVGLVAHLKKEASRQIVLDANEMLVRMSHRGACGCEVNTGDGAGTFNILSSVTNPTNYV